MATEAKVLTGPWRWSLRLATTVVVALVIAFYFWTAASGGQRAPFGGESRDYYNLLVHGFLDGHLHMKVTPDPALRVELPNRIVSPGASYLLDASFYRGKYFLYFGVTPAVTLFFPWTVLTGHDFPEWAAVPLFASLAYLLVVAWLAVMRREFFPRVGGTVWVSLVAALGLANGVPVVLRRPLFYEVAVTAGWMWSAAGVLCLTLALVCPRRAVRWLAAMSACAGLATGSRPTLIIGGGLALAAAAGWLWWRERSESSARPVRLLAAAAAPFGGLLAGLAWYNWARFGSPFEFGLTYQLGSNSNGFHFTLASLWRSLRVYYFTPPDVGWFFPFVAPGPKPVDFNPEQVHGQFWFLPLLVFGIFMLGWAVRARTVRAELVAVGAFTLLWSVASLVLVGMAPGQSNRYALDFHPLLFSVTLLGVLAVAHNGRRVFAAVAVVWLFAIAGLNVGSSLQVHRFFQEGNRREFERLARWCDRAVWPLFRLTRPALGAVELRVTFSRGVPGRLEPLVVAGAGTDLDSVMVRYLDAEHASLIFDHQEFGSREGAAFALRPGEARTLVLELGTLCPPEWHPWYDSLPTGAARLATHVRVLLDGAAVLSLDAPCYHASPNQVTFGRRRGFLTGAPDFSGQIKFIRGLGADLTWLSEALAETGPVRLRVRLPQDRYGEQEPLLLTGVAERFDLVCVRYDTPHSISVGVQHAGWPAVKFSAPLAVDYNIPHTFEIELGSLAPGAWLPATQLDAWRARGASVRLDGRTVMVEPFFSHPAEIWQQVAGCTPFPLSTSRRLYGGPMEILPRSGLTAASLATALVAGRPLSIRLRFPMGRTGVCEPLITTGITGRGDSLYVRYVDSGHIVLGFDHWGAGGAGSAPIAVDYDADQELEVSFGALLSAADPGRTRLRVTINGAIVLDSPQVYHPATLGQTQVGVNAIGLSTSEGVFTGEILSVAAR